VIIYNKGDLQPGTIPLPNVGREAHTYLHHIVTEYERLADMTAFCQGSPYPHSPHFIQQVLEMKEPFSAFNDLGSPLLENDSKGRPHHTPDWFLDIDSIWRQLFVVEPPDVYVCGAGAIFTTSREAIIRLPRSFYQKALEISTQTKNAPWELERLWPYVFTRPVEQFRVF
jgi:hypothetical protein